MSIIDLLREPAVGSLLGILGIIAAAYFYFKSNRKKKFVFVNKESSILGDASDSLTGRLRVSFDGRDVARVTRSVFVFWNAGSETIRGCDIASSDNLRIDFPVNSAILAVSVERQTRPAISAQVVPDTESPNRVSMSFAFLDNNDGFNVVIIHTAPTGKAVIRGTIVGMRSGVKDYGPPVGDIEAYLTPKPQQRRVKRIILRIMKLVIKFIAFVVPPVLVVSTFFSDVVLSVFPSFGTPDTMGMWVAGRVNVFWLFIGVFILTLEIGYFAVAFKQPPKALTN